MPGSQWFPCCAAWSILWPEQVQRGHRFGPWAAASVVSSVAGLGAVCAAIWVLHDHRAVVWRLSAQALAMVAATHALAAVPYRLSLAAVPLQRALRFGVPLMVNGLALAAMAQLDRCWWARSSAWRSWGVTA